MNRFPIYWAIVLFELFRFASMPLDDAQAEDWFRWRGPRSDGVSSETQWSSQWPAQGPKVAWRAKVGTGFSSFSVSNGRVLTAGNTDDTDTVFCFDVDAGQLIWKYDSPAPLDDRFFEGGPTSTPSIDGDRVYSLSRPGKLACLNLNSGEVIWSKDVTQESGASVPGWGFSSSPVIHGEKLILGVGAAGAAFDKRDGKLLWCTDPGEAGYMTPLPLEIEGHWYALIANGRAYQLVDLDDGTVAWKHRWLTTYGCNAADPIISGQKAFISSGYNRGSALLSVGRNSVATIWAHKEMQNQLNSSVKLGDSLFGFSGNDTGEVELKCIEFSSGKTIWSHSGLGLGSLLAAGDRLIVLSDHGELWVAPASQQGFQPLAHAEVLQGKCWTVPVLSNGRIFCRNADGDVVCVDVRLAP